MNLVYRKEIDELVGRLDLQTFDGFSIDQAIKRIEECKESQSSIHKDRYIKINVDHIDTTVIEIRGIRLENDVEMRLRAHREDLQKKLDTKKEYEDFFKRREKHSNIKEYKEYLRFKAKFG